VKYAGVHVIGGTQVIYLNRGAVALTHVEVEEGEASMNIPNEVIEQDAKFLAWLYGQMVNVYGESPDSDLALQLKATADRMHVRLVEGRVEDRREGGR
jgi:hypothetical protein